MFGFIGMLIVGGLMDGLLVLLWVKISQVVF